MSTTVPHPRRFLLFLVLSLVDLLLTGWLIQPGDGLIYEGNPLASWWLTSYGWPGLAAFKVLMVLVATSLVGVICLYRPRTGGRVLSVSCLAVGAVVAYSCCLAGLRGAVPSEVQQELDRGAAIQKEMARCRDDLRFRRQLTDDVVRGRCTLAEAVSRLDRSPQVQDPVWRERLRAAHPGLSDDESLAVLIMAAALPSLEKDSPGARRLEDEFRALYGSRAPFLLGWVQGGTGNCAASPPRSPRGSSSPPALASDVCCRR
jgi:hypothetical protein